MVDLDLKDRAYALLASDGYVSQEAFYKVGNEFSALLINQRNEMIVQQRGSTREAALNACYTNIISIMNDLAVEDSKPIYEGMRFIRERGRDYSFVCPKAKESFMCVLVAGDLTCTQSHPSLPIAIDLTFRMMCCMLITGASSAQMIPIYRD